jgi:riboflavin kinase/FMN adenylyltransferase
MEIIWGLSPHLEERIYLTIGVFDGLHLGHQEVIGRMVGEARERGVRTSLITFDPHPLKVTIPDRPPLLLLPMEGRLRLIGELGISKTFILPFDSKLASMDGEEFLKGFLLKNLNIEKIFVGEEYLFGRDRKGNLRLLKRVGEDYGFDVVGIPPYRVGEEVASSSKIRDHLLSGRIEEAERMLGRPHSIIAEVKEGTGRGGEIGYPTANLIWDPDLLLPKDGVYGVYVIVDGRTFKGMSNIGLRPTFGEKERSFEVHIFDFDEMIYGRRVEVIFKVRIRDEIEFGDIYKLKDQLERDKTCILSLLKE